MTHSPRTTVTVSLETRFALMLAELVEREGQTFHDLINEAVASYLTDAGFFDQEEEA